MLKSWGNYPLVESNVQSFTLESSLQHLIKKNVFIPYGNGRSYGDCALYHDIVRTDERRMLLGLDRRDGVLHIESGALFSDILEKYVPSGWFPLITPGTKEITVGGAIAADVHGKNHHKEGCFSECVKEFRIMTAEGKIETCSKDINVELFRATCGGMGLTGVILDAKIQLKKISSSEIDQVTIKNNNLKETFESFERYSHEPYSVAWIDCLAKGKKLGRSVLTVGDFAKEGELTYKNKEKGTFPPNFSSFFLNKYSIKLFNYLYFNKTKKKVTEKRVRIDDFFYPLDAIDGWNTIYGEKGFTQYQFILPLSKSYEGTKEILDIISQSGRGSFLAVIKLYGEKNENYLSFPIKGYSVAIDFKIDEDLFSFLDTLDEVVNKYRGRIYLAKDARIKKTAFERGYPEINTFRDFRRKHALDSVFRSHQSERLGL